VFAPAYRRAGPIFFVIFLQRNIKLNQELEDYLKYIPEHSTIWELNPETNFIILKKPKFKNKHLVKYLMPYLKRPDFKINLDEIGSFVWTNIDGQTSIEEIADRLDLKFGNRIKPVNDRLGQFVQSLLQNKFIVLKSRT